MENKTGVIHGINGPVVYLKGDTGFKMSEMVYVGKEKLVGEVIGLTADTTTIQVFEETAGLRPVSYTHLDVYKRQPLPGRKSQAELLHPASDNTDYAAPPLPDAAERAEGQKNIFLSRYN